MSEPTPAHLDLDALADVVAGETDATGHLSGCASCTSRLGELTAAESRVVAALGGLPAPAMPDDVAQRLTAALAAEPAPAPAPRSAAVTALPARTAGRRWLPAAAAAAVLVLSAGAVGLAFLPAGGGDSGQSSVAGGAAESGVPISGTGTDYADEAAAARVVPELLGGPVAPLSSEDAEVSKDSGDSGDSAMASSSGAGDAAGTTEQAPADALDDGLARLRTPEGRADCLRALLPPEEPDLQPLALDYATYEGRPALAVLLPDPEPGKVAVFVVGADCTSGDEDLLTFLRVDAP